MFGDRASKLALSVLDDGDDLHITASFCPSEENSSTIGNSSVAIPQQPPTVLPSPTSTKEKSSNDDSTSLEKEQFNSTPYEEMQQSTKAMIRNIPSFARRSIRSSRKLWPSKKLSSMLSRQWSQRSIEDYQEFFQDGPPPTIADTASSVDGSIQSIRSSRVNVANGRNFLIRQKAQVVGRPSMANTDWDIGSLSSQSSKSGNNNNKSNRQNRRGVVTWEINSPSGGSVVSNMSQLTGDSFRSKHSRISRAMYMSSGNSLLGESQSESTDNDLDDMTNNDITNSSFSSGIDGLGDHDIHFCGQTKKNGLETVQEEEDYHIGGGGPNASSTIIEKMRRYKDGSGSNGSSYRRRNRKNNHATENWEMLSSLTTDICSVDGSSSSSCSSKRQRQRFFSESDIVFESRRERIEALFESREFNSSDFHTLFPYFGTETEDGKDAIIRRRTYSDSVILQTTSSWEEEEEETSSSKNQAATNLSQAWDSSMSSELWPDSLESSNRQRFFSESDIVFESRRYESNDFDFQSPKLFGNSNSDFDSFFPGSDFYSEKMATTRSRRCSDSVVNVDTSSFDDVEKEKEKEIVSASNENHPAIRKRLMSDPQFDSHYFRSTFSDEERQTSSSSSEFSTTSGTPLLHSALINRIPVFEPLTRRAGMSPPRRKSSVSTNGYSGFGGNSSEEEDRGRSKPTHHSPFFEPQKKRVEMIPTKLKSNVGTICYNDDGGDSSGEEDRCRSKPSYHRNRGRLHSDSDITLLTNAIREMEESRLSWPEKVAGRQADASTSRKHNDIRRLSMRSSEDRPLSKRAPPLVNRIETQQAGDNQKRSPLKPLSSKLSSPTAASAAKLIASNLRPSTANSVPVPTNRNQKLHDYYWNNEGSDCDDVPKSPTVLEDVLWNLSSESFDDIL